MFIPNRSCFCRQVMRYLTAGESHGPAVVGIIEGLPSNLTLDKGYIDRQLARRQGGYGRGGRMAIEKDRARFLSGVRFGRTLGSPLSIIIENRDWVNWQKVMSADPGDESGEKKVTSPRPGHADLAGGLKYLHADLRSVLERASARETAMRVAVGAVAQQMLEHFGITVLGYVVAIGEIRAAPLPPGWHICNIKESAGRSPLYCPDGEAEKKMLDSIDRARENGDTVGGIIEVQVEGVPPGLGSYVHWDRRLDGQLAAALMSIPGIKAVEVGLGLEAAARPGSRVHDPIELGEEGLLKRPSNNAGGLEGGVSNGQPITVRAAMKPIPTLLNSLPSVDLETGHTCLAEVERSDVCAVPAASVVGEAAVSWEIARALREKFSGDSLQEMEAGFQGYRKLLEGYLGDIKC